MSANLKISRRGLLLTGAMVSGAALAVWLRPDRLLAEQQSAMELKDVIPEKFGDWRVDERIPVILPAPDVQAAIDMIYAQTLARTYVHQNGQQIMLSIAYGRNQSDAVQVHKPEGCYQGQGFGVEPLSVAMLELVPGRSIPLRRMIASRFSRQEPVSYYTLIGNVVSSTAWREKVVQLKYGLHKKIPDGLLVRVSSVGSPEKEFPAQEIFLKDLMAIIPPDLLPRVVGTESYL
jgi:EpsI family protein